jgi:HEAT repeat protein
MASIQKVTSEFRGESPSDIERMVAALESVRDGELALNTLVAQGERAIPSLRRFLLCGMPKSVYVGRQRAVLALSELNAVDVLIEYLIFPKQIADPALRYSEEAVENTAARELGKRQTEGAFRTLLHVIESRPLPGAIDAIGKYRRPEAVPLLIQHLGDDVARPVAESSLRELGSKAVPNLIDSVRSPEPSANSETPGSLRRRQSALRVLSDSEWTVLEWKQLRFLLYETDPLLSVLSAKMALHLRYAEDLPLALDVLIGGLSAEDWTVVAIAEEALLENYQTSCVALETAISQRAADSNVSSRKLLALLRSIVHRGEAA